jgi:hypothetical protein
MSRVRLVLIALGMAFAVPALTGANVPLATTLSEEATSATAPMLAGTWKSAPEETPLSTAFDESVWGKNAKSVRTVEMTIKPTGEATLIITRKILDGRGRAITAATSIEQAELAIGAIERRADVRADHAVTVKHAERRYPDDPGGTWTLDGLRVMLSTFSDDPASIEVRVDTPEGRGSFWEKLRRR